MKNIYIFLLMLSTLTTNAQIPNTLTNEDKIYGLSKFWQEVNYNFVYLEKINRVKWDSTYCEMIKTVQQTENDYEYYRALQKFCALLKDGHTNIRFPESIDTLVYNSMFGTYRIFLKNIDDKAIIIRTNQSKKNELPVGSEIIEVNGLPTQEYINQFVAPYISSSTDHVLKDEAVKRLLEGLKGQKYNIMVKTPEGKMKTLSLIHENTLEKEVYPPFEERQLLDFKWYANQIVYVALNSFRDSKINTLFIQKLPELYKAKGLIIDLRFNAGGNTRIGTNILKYLTNDTILYGAKSMSRNHIPPFKAWGRFVKPGDTTEWAKKSLLCSQDKYYYLFDYAPVTFKTTYQKINIPTVILIGHNTVSAAEDFLIYADNQKHIIKIGENSCGSTGEALLFDLPGGGSALVCTIKDTYPDDREFVGYGVKPDIKVKPTLNDYIQMKDPSLDKALEYLKTKMK
ncbi:MAG: peptidase S41 [Bacteroidetes bacterium]|nr:peptidase S41 [Bacteroidota bacterium]